MLASVVLGYYLLITLCVSSQTLPPSLWKWSTSNSSQLPHPPPNTSADADYNSRSSCGGGGDSNTSWSCPHMMLLSPDMLHAAKADGNDNWALYGVAGIGQVSDCGKCYQLEITGGGSWPVGNNKYIVQAINTGGDVSSGQFDIFIGAGGFGIFDSCSSDCQYGTVCSGGNCNAPQFGGNFYAWTPDGNCYGGGLHDPNGCEALVNWKLETFAENTLVYDCKEALYKKYHQNFNVNFKEVKCPESLVRVTGIKHRDEVSLSAAHEELVLDGQGRTTTMMDCCKPTCAWRQNVEYFTDPNWPQVFACNKEGYILKN